MSALPAWAHNPKAVSLLRAIAAIKPDYIYTSPYEGFPPCPKYRGQAAKDLRAIYEASGHRSATWSEEPDGLIEAVLDGSVALPFAPYTRMSINIDGDRGQVAA